jgi:putative addiction module killer protein
MSRKFGRPLDCVARKLVLVMLLWRGRRARIAARVRRLAFGNPGDVEPVGQGVSEMRIHYGPGYRVYFVEQGKTLVVVLWGGSKSTQDRDIKKAKKIAAELEE